MVARRSTLPRKEVLATRERTHQSDVLDKQQEFRASHAGLTLAERMGPCPFLFRTNMQEAGFFPYSADMLPQDAAPIQAFAKLECPQFCYYIRKLRVTMGRGLREGPNPTDIDLGPHKAISRRHAMLQYNFDEQRFDLIVLGKNGISVDNRLVLPSMGPFPLKHRAVLAFGSFSATFLLCTVDNPKDAPLEAQTYALNRDPAKVITNEFLASTRSTSVADTALSPAQGPPAKRQRVQKN
ncbi:uncharacterized protein BJ171DRAFT_579622 [Polychytrium aggregatum]|uniref:uncharacterized protein n=1 Tax=Polychytrium aggregatum TaxID=110093 RepID=UPI0022FF3EC4|nr:uncharacterized protein BJ171DRAFT_579622 [Polychytrium aggregatum]KAI9206646.1 hypothetical protein BJ171DRAFT_579622 [Polychytrium aggregatum]